jgi:hypothetical protein
MARIIVAFAAQGRLTRQPFIVEASTEDAHSGTRATRQIFVAELVFELRTDGALGGADTLTATQVTAALRAIAAEAAIARARLGTGAIGAVPRAARGITKAHSAVGGTRGGAVADLVAVRKVRRHRWCANADFVGLGGVPRRYVTNGDFGLTRQCRRRQRRYQSGLAETPTSQPTDLTRIMHTFPPPYLDCVTPRGTV